MAVGRTHLIIKYSIVQTFLHFLTYFACALLLQFRHYKRLSEPRLDGE